MAHIRFAFYLVYRWYKMTGQIYYVKTGRTPAGAYLATICAYLAILTLNIFTLTVLFHLPGFFPDASASLPVWFLKLALVYFIPGYLIITRLVKEEDMEQVHYEEAKIRKGYVILLTYVVLSFAFLIIVEILRRPVG